MENLRVIGPEELEQKARAYASDLCALLERLNEAHKAELEGKGIKTFDPVIPIKDLFTAFMINLSDTLCEKSMLLANE
jgi:hypothetical protein